MLDSVDIIPRIEEILRAHKGMEGSLLPILHAIQAEFSYIPQSALPIIAAASVAASQSGLPVERDIVAAISPL